MHTLTAAVGTAVTLLLTVSASAQTPDPPTLTGTSWQLVRFQGGDDTVLTPSDGSRYTITFGDDGRVSARIDCNRGSGTWTSSRPGQLAFGPMALTRAMCPPGSMHDKIAKDWTYVRSYVVKDGHLFLALMADGGIYEFEPIPAGQAPPKSPVAAKGPATLACTQNGKASGTIEATFYETTPGMVLLVRSGQTRVAFSVPAASGARYEGEGLRFWEARGEATVWWSGLELTCRPER